MLDVGLMSAMADLDPAVILDAPRIFKEFKGALTMMPHIVQQVPLENGGFCELVNVPFYAIGTICA